MLLPKKSLSPIRRASKHAVLFGLLALCLTCFLLFQTPSSLGRGGGVKQEDYSKLRVAIYEEGVHDGEYIRR
jgi:hypothetical protein